MQVKIIIQFYIRDLTIQSLMNSNDYSDVSIKNIDILPNRQYIANIADSAQEQYS